MWILLEALAGSFRKVWALRAEMLAPMRRCELFGEGAGFLMVVLVTVKSKLSNEAEMRGPSHGLA